MTVFLMTFDCDFLITDIFMYSNVTEQKKNIHALYLESKNLACILYIRINEKDIYSL